MIAEATDSTAPKTLLFEPADFTRLKPKLKRSLTACHKWFGDIACEIEGIIEEKLNVPASVGTNTDDDISFQLYL